MSGRRIGALVAFVVGLAAAMFVYVRSRPVVSESELREVLHEVEVVRASLDDVECERAAVLGAPTQDALPLEEVLLLEGPFAECWDAVGGEEIAEYLEGHEVEGFRFDDGDGYRARPLNHIADLELVRGVLSACSELPEEIGRQARTPNRCTPTPPSSEGWRRQNLEDGSERPKLLMARAIAVMARHGNMEPEDRLRLLIQGMATARDIGQGPAGILSAMLGTAAEWRLAADFVEVLQETSLSLEARAELHEALEVLANMPIDIHPLIASEGIAITDSAQIYGGGTDNEALFAVYAAATLLQRLMDSCPADISVDACLSQFPYPEAEVNETMHWLLGDRAVREESLQVALAIGSGFYGPYLQRMQGLRENARALQQILHWDAERDAGRCPEVSVWDPTTDHDQVFVDRNEENLYQLVTPGPERYSFYFLCPVPTSPTGPNAETPNPETVEETTTSEAL